MMPLVEYVTEGEQHSHTQEHCLLEADADAHRGGDIIKLKLRCDAEVCSFKGKFLSIRTLDLFFSWFCLFLLVQSGLLESIKLRITNCTFCQCSMALF